jgi:hypothetical protein
VPALLQTHQPPKGRGLGYWEEETEIRDSTSPEMAEFGPDTQSHIPWREHRMERDTSSTAPHEHETHNGHGPSQPHISAFDHYSTSPGIPEGEEWPGHHDNHGVGSPHSQTSTSSMVDSPGSRQSSEHRRSIDMSSGSAGEQHHMSLSERRQEKRKMKRFR